MLTGLINTDLPVSCQSWLTVSNHPCLRSDKIIMLLHTHSSHSWFNLTRSMSPHNGDQKLRKCLKSKKVTNRISVCKNEPPTFEGKFLIIFCLQTYICRPIKVKNLISQVLLLLLVLISWGCSVSWWKASDVTPAKVMVPPHMVQHTEQHPGADTGHDTDHQQYSVTWCDLGMRYKWKIITKYNWLKLSAASWTTFLSKLSTTAPL